MRRPHQIVFLGFFLGVIYSVPLVQSAVEAARGRRPQFLDVFLAAPTRPALRAFEKEMEDDSVVAAAARPWVQFAQFLLLGDAGEKVLLARDGWLFYQPDVRYLVEPAVPVTLESQDPFDAILGFRDQLAARGIRLLVIPVPGKPSLYGGRLTRRLRDDQVVSQTRGLISRLRRAGVETADLFAIFGGTATRREPYYLLRDTHWSGHAAQIAADSVAARLKELGWAPEVETRYTVRRLRVSRRSDIVRMIREPHIESRFPAEEVTCEQVIDAATGQPYRDDPASPVLVLGDSFLRIYQNDEPRSAGFIAHLARALGRPLASVVNDGGASTLVRQELARRPQLLRGKKLIIWEFVERDIRFGMEGWKRVMLPPAGEQRRLAKDAAWSNGDGASR